MQLVLMCLQAFSAWIHILVVRLFVESILRYGLPPAFLAAVVKPAPKLENKLRAVLAQTFGHGKNCQHSQTMSKSHVVGLMSSQCWSQFAVWHALRVGMRCISSYHSACCALAGSVFLAYLPLTCALLCAVCADACYWRDDGTPASVGTEIDTYPYVSLTVNTDH